MVEIHLFRAMALRVLTNLIVLTVNACHVAIAKEDSSSSPGTRNGGLFAMMVADCTDYRQVTRVTKPVLVFQAVDITLPGTNITRFQACFQRLSSALKFARTIQSKIRGFHSMSL